MSESVLPGIGMQHTIEERTKHQLDTFVKTVTKPLGRLVKAKAQGGIFFGLGTITLETSDTRDSIPLRRAHADALHRIREIWKNSDKLIAEGRDYSHQHRVNQVARILEQENERRRITQELYSHTLHEVNIYDGIGGRISILNETSISNEPPLVFIPGSSNDPESMETLAVELALQSGRKVIVIGYPDAPNGKTTPKFTDAVVKEMDPKDKTPTYQPYVEYFHMQLQQLKNQGILSEIFDLAGYSAGGAIAAKLISSENKTNWSSKVRNALIFNPAGAATFNDARFTQASIFQSRHYILDFPNSLRTTWLNDPRNPKTSDDKKRKLESWLALAHGTHYRIPDWELMKVIDGGKIIVYSGGKDYVTGSYTTFNNPEKLNNRQMIIIDDPKAHHNTVGTRPKGIVEKVFDLLKRT